MSNVKDKAVKVSSLAGTLVEVELLLNGLNPNAVRVELFVDAISGGESVRQEMNWARTLAQLAQLDRNSRTFSPSPSKWIRYLCGRRG